MLIEKLNGITLTLTGENIHYKADSPLTDIQRKFLMDNKPQLLEELKLINELRLHSILENCCTGTNPAEVLNGLLTQINVEDILAGFVPEDCLKAHIELWVSEGKINIAGNQTNNIAGAKW